MTEKHRENPDKRQELGKKENVAWYSMAERCSLRKRNLKIICLLQYYYNRFRLEQNNNIYLYPI